MARDAARARVRARARQARRLRAARAALEREGARRCAPLDQRAVDDAVRQAVPRARRLAARLPLAAAVAHVYLPPLDFPHVMPADPFAERGELPRIRTRRASRSARRARGREARRAAADVAARGAGLSHARTAIAVGAARRPALRVHAAGGGARGLSRSARRRRGHERGARCAAAPRRLRAAAAIRA